MLQLLKNMRCISSRVTVDLIKTNYYKRHEMKNYIFFMLPRYIMSGEAAIIKDLNSKEQTQQDGMNLHDIVKILTDYAPLSLAESWDNVGLLIEPFTKRTIKRIMLTNDLAVSVMKECMDKETDMVISYHPPLFSPIKKLSLRTWTEKVIQCCLENRIAVYSPHTTWDSVPGGISDWLTGAFDVLTSDPLQPYFSYNPPDHIYSLVVMYDDKTKNVTETLEGLGVTKSYHNEHGLLHEFVGSCKKEGLPQIYSYLHHNNISFQIYNKVPLPEPKTGIGRLCTFEKPITIDEAIKRVKQHTGVKYCRVGYAVGTGPDTLVRTAAICPGSGAKVLASVKADLYVTGEMLHHDILAAIHNNATVIMTNHSDSERGFLKVFAEVLKSKLNNKVEIMVSVSDKDPVQLA